MSDKEIKPPHIFVCTPMYGGQCYGYYAQSVLTLQTTLKDAGISSTFSFMFNESLITRARNALTHGFLKSEATHLLFIDSDIRFNPNDVVKMIEADKEIICGLYPKKEINFSSVKRGIDAGVPMDQLKYYTGAFVVNLVGYQGEVTVPVNEPVEIWNGGTGFMLIKREVFEKLKDVCPTYNNDVTDLGGTIQSQAPIVEYFATSIEPETNRLLSEDYHFCHVARNNGVKVWGAPWVRLAHIGTYTFEGQLIPAA